MKLQSGIQADIQGLRGVAVLLVVLYHAEVPGITGGYVGVDVFFVISGYLITSLLLREREKTGSIDFAQFYARRARRLLPAAAVVFAATLAIGRFVFAPHEQEQIGVSGLTAALYVSNYWFANRATDYFAGNAETDVFLHTWSLAVEEQFYLVWPGLMALAFIGAGRLKLRLRLLVAILLVSVVSYLACRHFTWKSQPWAFFGMHTRAWEFGVGAIAFLVTEHMSVIPRPRSLLRVAGWAGISLIATAALSFTDRTIFPGSAATVPVLGTFLTIVAGRAAQPSGPTALLASRPLVWLGDISYSWYLWHWPVLVLTDVVSGGRDAPMIAAAVLVSVLLAQVSYRFVENPIRFSPFLVARARLTLTAALALSLGSSVVAATAHFDANARSNTDAQRRFSAARMDRPTIYGTECHAGFDAVGAPECDFGSVDSMRQVVLFGDSHAAHWFPAFERLSLERNWRLVSLTKSGCPSVIVSVFDKTRNRKYFECDQWRDAIIRRIEKSKPPLVVISNSSAYVNSTTAHASDSVSLDEWERGLRSLVSRLTGAGVAVLIIRDTPSPGFDAPLCLARAAMRVRTGLERCTFELASVMGPINSLVPIEDAVTAHASDATLLDLTAQVCPQEPCAVDRGGQIVFNDTNHLTATFSRALSTHILQHLRIYAHRKPDSSIRALEL